MPQIPIHSRAIKLDPSLPGPYLNRGLLKLYRRREAETEKDFELCRRYDTVKEFSIEERIEKVMRQLGVNRASRSLLTSSR
jgi:hypothetical protein